MMETVCTKKVPGFSLIEMMMALTILTFGLLAVGPLLHIAAGASSLARSKDAAAVAAQDLLETLSDLYRRNPSADDLSLGDHGPRQTQIMNPTDETILNRFDLNWTITNIYDPRPAKVVDARLIRVTITPIQSSGSRNNRPSLNKVLSVTTILSPKMP
jgi:prepilin-type N-terminal cleavage/methylation domain-containing protein